MTVPELIDKYTGDLWNVEQSLRKATEQGDTEFIGFRSGRVLQLRTVIRDLETLLTVTEADHK